MQPSDDRADGSRQQLEVAARAALELPAGRVLTEPEWAAMRARLLELVGIFAWLG